MKKIFSFVIIFLIIASVTGCGKAKIKEYEPTSKNDVINYAKTEVYDQTGDKVEVKIVSDRLQVVCLKYSVVRCIKQATNKKVREYTVEISNPEIENLTVTSTFFDSYKQGNKIIPRYITKEYELEKNYLERNKEVNQAFASSNLQYKIYRSAVGANTDDIFLVVNDSNTLKRVISTLNLIAENENYGYGYGYRLFIVKNADILNSLKLESYEKAREKDEYKYNSRKQVIMYLSEITEKEERTTNRLTKIYNSSMDNLEIFSKFDDNSLLSDNKYLIYVASKKGTDATEEGFFIYGIK